MLYVVEHTDLFGGEANYAWINRYEFEAPADASRRTLVRKAKALCGLTGARCTVQEYGGEVAIRPRGRNEVVFVSALAE